MRSLMRDAKTLTHHLLPENRLCSARALGGMSFLRNAILLALCLFGAPAWAHKLTVFAFVEAGDVVVEAKFTSGKLPVSGEVRIYGADEALLWTHPLGSDGTLRFPFDPAAANGLMIEVEASEGHSDFWILTPEDISAGADG